MSAIPPAAAVPLKNIVGSVQNGPRALVKPMAERDSAAVARSGASNVAAVAAKPTAPATRGAATWRCRSPVRSE